MGGLWHCSSHIIENGPCAVDLPTKSGDFPYIYIVYIWLVAWNMFYFSIYIYIWGFSSSQLTFIFFRGVGQPPTSIYIYSPLLYNFWLFNIAMENHQF